MFVIKNILHLDINVMPIGALAATFIVVALISFSLAMPDPLSDPDDDKEKKKEKAKGSKFYNYFVKPITTTLSVWIICWLFMAFLGCVPDDFWQSSEERGKLVKCIVDKQNEIDNLKKIAADQNEVIEIHIRKMQTISRVLNKVRKNRPDIYNWLKAFFSENTEDN